MNRIKHLICSLFLMALSSAAVAIEPGAFPIVGDTLTAEQSAKAQQRTVREAARLKPQRKGVTDTYVVVIALWNDPVFVSEATAAAAILSQRYDAHGRTLILTSGTGQALPDGLLSTPETIAAALKGVGKHIDPKEDLVIVFVTSHGAETGELGLKRLGDDTVGAMTPLWLKAKMDEAGIDTRFVIVSACFSGHFVPVFEDMDTAIFTAASSQRPSFGCNAERDWTFFGDALFNHQLRGGADFEIAQASAGLLIHSWEMKEELLASQPQRHVGLRAGERIREAESYGRAVGCVADLWHFSQDGSIDDAGQTQVSAALSHFRDKARFIGKSRHYSRSQVDQHLEAAKALPNFGNGFKTVNLRAQACLKTVAQ